MVILESCFQLWRSAKIRCGWKKFKDMARLLYKRIRSLKLRGSTYNGCVESALCYGDECWACKENNSKRKLQITEMRMQRMKCGKILEMT